MTNRTTEVTNEADMGIRRRVLDYVASLQIPSLRQVRVVVENGTLLLRGEVHSFYQKQLLLSCQSRIPGVTKLVDEVRVLDGPAAASA
jgi:osmotically-inducible protein OsmY